MNSRRNISLCFALIIAPALSVITVSGTNAASPIQTQVFKSSSNKTAIVYFAYDAQPCGAGLPCDFRGNIQVPSGFDQAEVFLSGFKLEAAKQSDTVSQVRVSVTKHRYDAKTGEMEIGVSAGLETGSGQNYSCSISFVVILTGANLATFSPVNTGCTGIESCKITKTLPAAVPAGMKYIGLATQNWSLGSHAGPLVLNTLAGFQDGTVTVHPPSVNLEYTCIMSNQTGKNQMYFEWAAEVIAFDPTEMEQNGSPFFPKYYFTTGALKRIDFTDSAISPSRTPIRGFLNALEGFGFTYQAYPYPSIAQNQIWAIETSANNFRISATAPDTAMTDYGIFLGTKFGDYTTAEKYAFELDRAIGLLR